MAKKTRNIKKSNHDQIINDYDKIKSKHLEKLANKMLQNLIGKKKHIHCLEVYIKNEDTTVDVTCHREDFIGTLEENLQTHVYHEDYEACAGIKKAIEYLKGE